MSQSSVTETACSAAIAPTLTSAAVPGPRPRQPAMIPGDASTSSPEHAPLIHTLPPALPVAQPAALPPPLPSGTTVLHIGDSFAGALGYELERELEVHGVDAILKYEKSTYIPTWAWKRELADYLGRYAPDLVLITLGANELGIGNPAQRAENVQRLVQRLEGRPCVWVGIPLWQGARPDLMEVIRDNCGPCVFLDSHALLPDLERARDRIHPSLAARSRWAQAVVAWLTERRNPDGEQPWSWKDESGLFPAELADKMPRE